MSQPSIQSQDVKIAEVFQTFYVVPSYQREYVWQPEQVEQLLMDISEEMAGEIAGTAPEYFIGSIVICRGKDGTLDLIDGQQRMTTLFLTLCAIRDRLKIIKSKPSGTLGNLIAAGSDDESGNERIRHRLELQYEDSGDILYQIASGNPDFSSKVAKNATRSVRNIIAAYETVSDFLIREIGANEQDVKRFYGYLINKVKLIRIETENVAKALKIFETINDRGVGLDSMDLLKNLLFMKADRHQFDKLKSRWKELQDTIFKAGEKPLRFLRYFIFSQFDVDLLREDEIYSWMVKNADQCGYSKDPVAFAEGLLGAAVAYANFLKAKDADSFVRPSLESLNILSGSASRQHLILLMAARHLTGQLLDQLVRQVENLLFIYTVTREHTRTFERTFARWATTLRGVKNEAELDKFIDENIQPAKADLSERFSDAMRRMTFQTLQKYRLRYLLAKVTQQVDINAYGVTATTRFLSSYASSEYEIEHIFPQDPNPECVDEFGPYRDFNIAQKLGNLILIEKSINASMSNDPFSRKRHFFKNSKLLLTKSLAETPKIGSTKIDLAVKSLPPFTIWNEDAIEKRQELLVALAKLVWEV